MVGQPLFRDVVASLHDELMHVIGQLPALVEQHELETADGRASFMTGASSAMCCKIGARTDGYGRDSKSVSFAGNGGANLPELTGECIVLDFPSSCLCVPSERTPIVNGSLCEAGTATSHQPYMPEVLSGDSYLATTASVATEADEEQPPRVTPIVSDPSVEAADVYSIPHTPHPLVMRDYWKDIEVGEALLQQCTEHDLAAVHDVTKTMSHISQTLAQFTKSKSKRGNTERAQPPPLLQQSTRSGRGWTIHPQSNQRIAWDLFSVLFIAYDIFVVPLVAFRWNVEVQEPKWQSTLEWVAVSFWTLDMIMNFRTGYYDGPTVERSPDKVAIAYLRSWFYIDFVILAAEYAGEIFHTAEGFNAGRVSRFVRLTRLCKLLRIVKFQNVSGKLECGLNSSAIALGLGMFKLAMALVICVHFLTCGWYGIGSSGQGTWVEEWDMREDDLVYAYVISARWTLAQINGRTDQARGRSMVEAAYTCVCALISVIFVSLFISTITTNMVELQRVWAEPLRHLRLLNTYLEHRCKVSFRTAWHARKHLRSVRQLQGDKEIEDELLAILPKNLRLHLLYEVRSPVLIRHHLFDELNTISQKVSMSICSRLIMTPARPHEIIFEFEDEAHNMFFVELGMLRYESGVQMKSFINPARTRGLIQKTFMAPVLSCDDSHEDADEDACSSLLCAGKWVSEPAVWLENWKHRGLLTCTTHATLLSLEASMLVEAAHSDADCLQCLAVYARLYTKRIPEMEIAEDLSDLEHGRVVDVPFATLLAPEESQIATAEEVSRPGNWFRVVSPFAESKSRRHSQRLDAILHGSEEAGGWRRSGSSQQSLQHDASSVGAEPLPTYQG